MSTTLRTQISIPGICDAACLKKLRFLLSGSFTMTEDNNVPPHIIFKAELRRVGLPREVHIEVFVNSNVEIKTSPEVESSFSTICADIERILKEAVNILSGQNTVRVERARRIKDYMSDFSVEDEVERMVIVTLCDIVLDLMVTEKFSHFTSKREDLEDESVGVKLGKLEKQYTHMPLYNSKAIRDIRDLRNRVAHGGATIARDEADYAKSKTLDIFELF